MGNFISKFTGKQIDDAIAKALADKSISKASIDSQGHLIMEFDDGNAIDLGEAKGEKGEKGEKGDTGERGAQGVQGAQGIQGVPGATGERGEKGESGAPFSISKVYESVSAMNAGYASDGVEQGGFVIIDTGNVDDEDNAKLYYKGANGYSYLTDLSGAAGMKGEKGDTGATGAQGPRGAQGPQGVQGIQGAQGPAGSDANVTAANIQTALGYAPVKPSDIPTALKNPYPLVFTGAANGSYDGSEEMSVEILPPTIEPPTYAENVAWLNANGDTSKLYVLPDGYLYAYKTTTRPLYTNLFDKSSAVINAVRTDWDTTKWAGGFVGSNIIPITVRSDTSNPALIRIRGVKLLSWNDSNDNIRYFNGDHENAWNASIRTLAYNGAEGGANIESNGDIVIKAGWTVGNYIAGADSNYKYFCINASVNGQDGVSISEADLDNIIITVDEEIKDGQMTAWANTGVKYQASASDISPLRNKKVLVMGDSISTDYYGDYTKWVTVLKNNGFFPSDVLNSSIHATGFVAQYTGEGQSDNDFIDRITAISDKDSYDLVIVFGGINDYLQSVQMGESGQDKDTYFKPAVDYFFEYLVKNFTQARLVVLSPLRTYNIWKNTAGGSQATGHYQTEYADYIREVAKKYCLPVLNLTEESGFCPFVDEFKSKWTLIPSGYTSADGVHPNAVYQENYLAPMIKGFLSGLYGG